VASLALHESRVTPSDNDALKITWPVVRGGFYEDNHWGDATTYRFVCQRPLDGFGTSEEIKEQPQHIARTKSEPTVAGMIS